jgi:hypothetical protein
MDCSSGHEGECTGAGLKRSFSNLNCQLTLDDMECFLFTLVPVRGWARRSRRSRKFDEAVTAAGVATYGLVGVPAPRSETVFPSPGPSTINSATLMMALLQSAVVL